ncbi:hypothetical protein RDI58_028931 [Solanum bulbocastanum]|uniref:Uncharacterized protein n=1 Tax=Solanum bulbocastanum TaxID=147425 RepID=A0AAN8SWJ2_SOLBU
MAAGQPSRSDGPELPLSSDIVFPRLQHPNAPHTIIVPKPCSDLPNEHTFLPNVKSLDQYVDLFKTNKEAGINNSTVEPIPVKKLSYKDRIPRINDDQHKGEDGINW